MAIMSCPECGKEISDQAKACPNCGYPIPVESASAEKNSTDHKQKRKKIIILSSVLAVALAATIALLALSAFKDKVASIKHKSKGYSISLGMKKEEVDRILDEEHDGEYISIYENDITIGYEDGCVETISTENSQFETFNGIHVWSTVDDVFEKCGETEIVDGATLLPDIDDSVKEYMDIGYVMFYYFDWKGDVCDVLDAEYSLSLYLDETLERVKKINFSYF